MTPNEAAEDALAWYRSQSPHIKERKQAQLLKRLADVVLAEHADQPPEPIKLPSLIGFGLDQTGKLLHFDVEWRGERICVSRIGSEWKAGTYLTIEEIAADQLATRSYTNQRPRDAHADQPAASEVAGYLRRVFRDKSDRWTEDRSDAVLVKAMSEDRFVEVVSALQPTPAAPSPLKTTLEKIEHEESCLRHECCCDPGMAAVFHDAKQAHALTAEVARLREENGRLKDQDTQIRHRILSGEGEPGRYSSVTEMCVGLARKHIKELEAENARLTDQLTAATKRAEEAEGEVHALAAEVTRLREHAENSQQRKQRLDGVYGALADAGDVPVNVDNPGESVRELVARLTAATKRAEEAEAKLEKLLADYRSDAANAWMFEGEARQ